MSASHSTRTVIHRGAKFDLEMVRVPSPGGGSITREVVRHPGAVVIVPLLDTPQGQRVLLIRNRRIALDASILELPAGTLEPMEPPPECARRELAEETGYEAAHLLPLARFYTTPGLTDELMWAFVATGLRPLPAGPMPEADEDLSLFPVATGRALEMIASGELMDAKSMLALLLARERGLFTGS